MNLVIISGRLTKDNDLQMTSNGTEILKQTVAVAKNKDQANFIDIVAFKNTAKFLNTYTSKGAAILVKGELMVDCYKAKDGSNRYKTYVIANQVELIGSKKEDKPHPNESEETQTFEDDDSDLPF